MPDGVQHILAEAMQQLDFADIDQPYAGRLGRTGAAVQAVQVITAQFGVVQAFQRRCGAAEDDRDVQGLGAYDGEVAGVVMEPVLLFVAAVVFFIDDDQAGLRQVGEGRRARTDHDPAAAAGHGRPGPRPRAVRKPGMQHMHRHRQARAEARQGLRGQADFRNQHQGLFTLRQAALYGPYVDFGLAAAGHAFQQVHGEAGRLQDIRQALALLGIEFRAGLHVVLRGMPAQRHAFHHGFSGQGFHRAAPLRNLFVQPRFVQAISLQLFCELEGTAVFAQTRQQAVAGIGKPPVIAADIRQ